MMQTLIWITIILFSIMIHEVSHGAVAWALGDRTARDQGRLTLNPLKHIDFFWTLALPAALYFTTGGRFVFGMAKPVPVNFSRLHHFRRDSVLVALAGPFSNIILAFLLGRVWSHYGFVTALYAAYLNLGLAMFNLIPVPPLDGSRVLTAFLPAKWYPVFFNFEKFGILVIILLYSTGILLKVVLPAVQYLGLHLGLPALTLE